MPDTFRCETVIDAASSAAVFDLCLDVDLHVQSMARSHERVVDAPRADTWVPATVSPGRRGTSGCPGG